MTRRAYLLDGAVEGVDLALPGPLGHVPLEAPLVVRPWPHDVTAGHTVRAARHHWSHFPVRSAMAVSKPHPLFDPGRMTPQPVTHVTTTDVRPVSAAAPRARAALSTTARYRKSRYVVTAHSPS